MGSALSIDDVKTIDTLAKAIAREVVHQLTQLANPPAIVHTPGIVFDFGGFAIDVDRHEVTVHGCVINLKAREFALLTTLARNAGHVLSRDTLLEAAWPDDVALRLQGNRTVDVHIRRIRRQLGAGADRVETVAGVGYRFRDR